MTEFPTFPQPGLLLGVSSRRTRHPLPGLPCKLSSSLAVRPSIPESCCPLFTPRGSGPASSCLHPASSPVPCTPAWDLRVPAGSEGTAAPGPCQRLGCKKAAVFSCRSWLPCDSPPCSSTTSDRGHRLAAADGQGTRSGSADGAGQSFLACWPPGCGLWRCDHQPTRQEALLWGGPSLGVGPRLWGLTGCWAASP